MGIGLIISAIIIFFFGYLTPINDLYTLPISLIIIVFGATRVSKRRGK